MPNCFQLFRKGSAEPEKLSVVDREICDMLGVPCDDTYYTHGWFDCIGFLIACKNDCDLGTQKLRDEVDKWWDDHTEPRYLAMRVILAFLEARYTSTAWVQIGK